MNTFKIDFGSGFDVTESPADEFNIVLDLSEITAAGELGGTYPNPTVDATHAGSAHHAEAHTIPSHSDTTATGAELEELTDGSQTALHSHAGSGPTTVYKTADETVNNSTTLQDDDHISLSVLANEVWAFHMVLHSSSDATPDIKVGWSVPPAPPTTSPIPTKSAAAASASPCKTPTAAPSSSAAQPEPYRCDGLRR